MVDGYVNKATNHANGQSSKKLRSRNDDHKYLQLTCSEVNAGTCDPLGTEANESIRSKTVIHVVPASVENKQRIYTKNGTHSNLCHKYTYNTY